MIYFIVWGSIFTTIAKLLESAKVVNSEMVLVLGSKEQQAHSRGMNTIPRFRDFICLFERAKLL
jgi:hypothetical protein